MFRVITLSAAIVVTGAFLALAIYGGEWVTAHTFEWVTAHTFEWVTLLNAVVIIVVLRKRRAFGPKDGASVRIMRQAGVVAYWFCSGGALFLVLFGAWNFLVGKSGPPLVLLCLFAATFYMTGIFIRRYGHTCPGEAPKDRKDLPT